MILTVVFLLLALSLAVAMLLGNTIRWRRERKMFRLSLDAFATGYTVLEADRDMYKAIAERSAKLNLEIVEAARRGARQAEQAEIPAF